MVILFATLSFLLIVSAGAVVFMRSPIHCALALFVHLLGISALYAMLHAHFLAVVQIIVYAGAVVVLVLFVIMLLNLRAEMQRRRPALLLVPGAAAAVLFVAAVAPGLNDAFRGIPAEGASVEGTVRNIGVLLYSGYFFLFEAAGLLLLAATVGAVMIARKGRRE